MNIDNEYIINQIENILYSPIIYQKSCKIYLHKNRPIKINIIGKNILTYKDSESIGLTFFRLLVLKEVLQ